MEEAARDYPTTMPTNLKSKFKSLVRLKADESCHALKRHFQDGVLREVIGAWENQLRKYPNEKNFLWVDVAWTKARTVKGPEKKVGFKELKERKLSYAQDMIEQAYLAARKMGIVSRRFETEIDGHGVKRGFVLTPHDALCERTKIGCQFVGPCKVRGTSWRTEMLFTDEKPNGKTSIIFAGFLEKGRDEGRDEGRDQGRDQGRESSAVRGQGKSFEETLEFTGDSQETVGIPQSNSAYTSDSCAIPVYLRIPGFRNPQPW
jgi:hypothetical protein